MSMSDDRSAQDAFYTYVEYSREDPHPKFTAAQIGYIRSIDDILVAGEVDAVSQAESFRIRLGDGDVICREVPGIRPACQETVVYVQRYSDEPFAQFMEKVMDHIAGEPQGPKMFLRYIDPVRILIQDAGIFYPISRGEGALRWREKVRSRMTEAGALTGEFENGKFVLSDGRVFPVAAMRIERSRYSKPGYAPDW